MLCDLAIRRRPASDHEGFMSLLRVTSKRVLGTAGGGGKDEKTFHSEEALLAFLDQDLHLLPDVVSLARQAMQFELWTVRPVVFASDVQIPFTVLEATDLSLYE